MARLPWTKFQDFYLRLGFLKALVGVLSPQRRSVLNDAILRRLDAPLFHPARQHSALWMRIEGLMQWYGGEHVTASFDKPTVAESLLVDGDCPSLLFAVTGPTSYKILDWGHNVELVGRGNQITERGLLLRHLLPAERIERFLTGEVDAWNPFVLDMRERLFFLFHLSEIDRVTVELIGDLGSADEGAVFEASDAAKLTCRALFRVLASANDQLQPRDIPAFRTARELACTIAGELDMRDLMAECDGTARRKVPKPVKPSARKSSFAIATGVSRVRKTTKNADHQTIPRFEQLIDLGFLSKPVENLEEGYGGLGPRRRWRYTPTDAARRWAVARREIASEKQPFQWHHFATVAVAAFRPKGRKSSTQERPILVAEYLWRAYEKVRRAVGHTPLDSVALFGMLTAAADGVVIEMSEFHRLMLAIKQQSALPEHAFFASGNDLDKMFIQLKPGFLERLETVRQKLPLLEDR